MKRILTYIIVLFSLNVSAQPWSVNSQDFEFSMNITGVIKMNGLYTENIDTYIGAFVNSDCRGVVHPIILNSNEYVFFLTIYSNLTSGDTVRFKYFDENSNVYDFSQTIIFMNDAVYGSPDYLYEWMDSIEYSTTDFLSFSSEFQTGLTTIDNVNKKITLKINQDGDLESLVVNYLVPAGAKVYINQTEQESGITVNDFTNTKIYTVTGTDGSSTNWEVIITQALFVNYTDLISLSIYPNPVSNELIFENERSNKNVSFEILNSNGQPVYNGIIKGKTIVNMTDFTSGVYLLKLENEGAFVIKKILKE